MGSKNHFGKELNCCMKSRIKNKRHHHNYAVRSICWFCMLVRRSAENMLVLHAWCTQRNQNFVQIARDGADCYHRSYIITLIYLLILRQTERWIMLRSKCSFQIQCNLLLSEISLAKAFRRNSSNNQFFSQKLISWVFNDQPCECAYVALMAEVGGQG